MKRTPDPLLRTQPWKLMMVFGPIERILRRLELDGTIDVAGGQVVFKEDGKTRWYDLIAALRGVIEFHQRAADCYGIPAETAALTKFANKLQLDSPIFEADLATAWADLASCKAQAMKLRVSQAESLVRTIQIGAEIERISEAA